MSNHVQQFLLKAHPTEMHPKYYSWNIASICVLIGEDNRELAFIKAKNLIKKEFWHPISSIKKITIAEELMMQQDQNAIEQYQEAKKGNDILMAFPDGWCGFKRSPPLLFPKITEAFIDRVFIAAGGRRYEYNESIELRNADYILEDYIFELKLVEEERLIKDSVQDKIANLFKDEPKSEIKITSTGFDIFNHSVYSNIFRTPIENAIKSASKQIKSTKTILGNDLLKGGLIIINNGTSSITPSIFDECVLKSLRNNTDEIDSYLSINLWSITDGFNTSFNFSIKPVVQNVIQAKLCKAFELVMQKFMSEWAQNQFNQTPQLLHPLKPISFEKNGITFTKDTGKI